MRTPLTSPAEAYLPDADRDVAGQLPEWVVRCIAMLILFFLEHVLAMRLRRSRGLQAWWHDRPDLPAGSAQAEAAAVRGSFGNSIAWMCLRHGIGPGHRDWPELSRAIVAFGGSLDGFRAGAPPRGLHWWENPGVVAGMIPFANAPVAATAALLQRQAVADALPPAPNAMQAEAAHARLLASWLAASVRQVFARAGPGPSTGPPRCAGITNTVMFDARGRSMASPANLIRAV
jgi:hypothetical protein